MTMRDDTVGRPMEILLIEDSLSDARLTIEALRDGQIKHRLTLVRDGDEAMQFLRREGSFAMAPRPDLILLDLKLPKKDGRQVLDEIRACHDLMRIPVVVLTISEEGEKRLREENLQVESYLIKPVDIEQFLTVIRQLNSFWRSDIILPPLD
ncbi:MAG: response regulator [Pirellulales bacterium]